MHGLGGPVVSSALFLQDADHLGVKASRLWQLYSIYITALKHSSEAKIDLVMVGFKLLVDCDQLQWAVKRPPRHPA